MLWSIAENGDCSMGGRSPALEGFFGAIEDVLELRQLEGLRQDSDLLEQERRRAVWAC